MNYRFHIINLDVLNSSGHSIFLIRIFAQSFGKVALKTVIAGAGGLIGSELLKLMLQDNNTSSVTALIRRPMTDTHPKLLKLIINFDQLEQYQEEIRGDVLFCCLGSTRKKTPDLADYRQIDHYYPLKLAEIAKANGISQFHIVSALGADHRSSNFYSRMKGELEQDLNESGLESLHIYQPSLLTGNRKENRTLEKAAIAVMGFLNPLLIGKLRKFRSIQAERVASAMLNQAHKNLKGIYVYPSDKIEEIA